MIWLGELAYHLTMPSGLALWLQFVTISSAGAIAAPALSAELKWQSQPGSRSSPIQTSAPDRVGFTLLSPSATGLSFTNWLGEERQLTNQILPNGSGLAAGDVDGDGWCDLYFCGLDGENALFRNLGGWKFQDITAQAGVACRQADASGAVFADLDGDGDLDLIVNSIGQGTRIFLNNGRASFQETSLLNQKRGGTSLALGDIDGDGDLDVYVANYRTVTIRDQPNTRFALRTVNGQQTVVSVDGVPITHPDLADRFNFRITAGPNGQGNFAYDENGEPDLLLRNDGGGRFTPIPFTGGTFLDEGGNPLTKPLLDWGLSVMFRDLNGDGAPDIYVCNDFKSPDRIWINNGAGRFRAIHPLALRQSCLSSMGVDFADLNRDGYDEFVVVDMLSRDHGHRLSQRIDIRPELLPIGAINNRPQYARNMLYLNRGDGTWAECAQFSGLEASEWSWSPLFLDVDLDGYEDLLVVNGFERDGMNVDIVQELERLKRERKMTSLEQLLLRRLFPRLATPNVAFRNLGNLKFQEVGEAWGFNLRGVSPGMCAADLDNDGDLDVVLNNINAPASLYRNDTSAPRVAVRLKGRSPNTRGIGAKISVTGGPVSVQTQEMICGGRYLSGDDSLRVFAAGHTDQPLQIQVKWRSGATSEVREVRSNRIYEIEEPSAAQPANNSQDRSKPQVAGVQPTLTNSQPLFIDVSHLIRHSHHEEPFDDFSVQPTLSHRLSQLGPGISWFDIDTDGWEDLIVPGGRGGRLAVFQNNGQRGFTPWDSPVLGQPLSRDQTCVLGWRGPAGKTILLAGSANYEDTPGDRAQSAAVRQFDLTMLAPRDVIPGVESSTGPLAMADVNGDGFLDLFVGGRVVPGRYPQPASSRLFLQRAGRFELDETNAMTLKAMGMVSGAVFSDLDADGDPDLILACDLGSLRLFRNAHGRLQEWNPLIGGLPDRSDSASLAAARPLTLRQLTGWWNSVTTADFDGDGRLDIAAGNWGQNTPYESFRPYGLRICHGELFKNGQVQIIEAYAEPGSGRLLPLQPFDLMGQAIPILRERLSGFRAYSKAALPEIYGEGWAGLSQLQVHTLESLVLLNRGDRFEAVPLPSEAQLAPAFAVAAADLDGDSHEDLFLSQNFFAVQQHLSRYDAGRGLWLKGDGRGQFQAVRGQESGLFIYGEQRGAALGDFDQDGRIDLAVAQNAAVTKLYRNAGARAGLRVRLQGPSGNPLGIGTALRAISGDKMGPVRETHAGSGYWSQDSAVPVLSAPGIPTRLWLRWPGGKTITAEVPNNAREITIRYDN